MVNYASTNAATEKSNKASRNPLEVLHSKHFPHFTLMNTIQSWSDIPPFADDESEAAFWLEHELAPKLMASSVHKPDTRESTTITLRFDPRMLARIKRLARSRYLNYKSMMKQWLAERIEEERKNLPNG